MRSLFLAGLAMIGMHFGVPARASVVLSGNFVQVGISDFGTLGSNGATPPGIRYDPTGGGHFGRGNVGPDYLTPGASHEGFAVQANGGVTSSNNAGTPGIGQDDFGIRAPTLLTGAATRGYDNAASWTGGDLRVTVTNSYFFNSGDKAVTVYTSLTAREALTDVIFMRSIDPNPDGNRHGNLGTVNTRGFGVIPRDEVVFSAGLVSALRLSLINGSGDLYPHATAVTPDYSDLVPSDVMLGLVGVPAIYPSVHLGNAAIHMAWSLGALAEGETKEVIYYYVLGDHEDPVAPAGPAGGGGGVPVPEPATLSLIIGSACLLPFVRRRRAYSAVQPPSTTSAVPVTSAAASEAR